LEPDAFFVPYVWRLVLQRCASIAWDEAHQVAAAHPASASAALQLMDSHTGTLLMEGQPESPSSASGLYA
jgi:hypothetical protein